MRSLKVLVVFAPRRWSRAAKAGVAQSPSLVYTSTKATTPRKGAEGCGVMGSCPGVNAGALRGVFNGVRDPAGVDAFSATFLSDACFCTVAGLLAGLCEGVRKREAGTAVFACSSYVLRYGRPGYRSAVDGSGVSGCSEASSAESWLSSSYVRFDGRPGKRSFEADLVAVAAGDAAVLVV